MKDIRHYSHEGETEIDGITFDVGFTYSQEIFGDGVEYPVDSEDFDEKLDCVAFRFNSENERVDLSDDELKAYVPQLKEWAKQYAAEI